MFVHLDVSLFLFSYMEIIFKLERPVSEIGINRRSKVDLVQKLENVPQILT